MAMADRTEEREQARLVRWSHRRDVRELAPTLAWLYHTPNGGQRTGFAGAQMTALGVKRGVPDLMLPLRSGPWSGLAIEMKTATGRLSPDQRAWLSHLDGQGWSTVVARSADAARDAIAAYLGLELPAL